MGGNCRTTRPGATIAVQGEATDIAGQAQGATLSKVNVFAHQRLRQHHEAAADVGVGRANLHRRGAVRGEAQRRPFRRAKGSIEGLPVRNWSANPMALRQKITKSLICNTNPFPSPLHTHSHDEACHAF